MGNSLAAALVALLAAGTVLAQGQAPLPLTGPAWELADRAYKAYARGDWRQAIASAREAQRQRPDVPELQVLLDKAEAAQARQARQGSTARTSRPARATAASPKPPAVPVAAAAPLNPEPATAAAPPAPLATPPAQPTPPAPPATAPAAPPPAPDPAYAAADAAYKAYDLRDYRLAASLANEAARLAPQNADWQKLASTAQHDAAFAAVRAGDDAEAIDYFKRTIDDVNALKLRMSPQLLFNTRRAVAEVSRETGVIASLSYRGAVSGLGLVPGAGTDTLQAGVEAYWRPWGYRNGRYVELFARAFETLYSKGGGATGGDTLQSAIGIRYKPLTDTNIVASFSRVFAAQGGRDDWLAQLGYSAGSGGDLRVDAPAWWTTRISAEAGRYLEAGRSYALAELQAGKSFRLGDDSGRWVLFPHLSVAADYDSAAAEQASLGIGPGISARYWFNEDTYSAPRSYVDITLQYRARLAGAQRAKGVFLNTTLSY
ncbi:MAG: bacteriophage N4 adsorption protein A [Pseudomonadota bacterium]